MPHSLPEAIRDILLRQIELLDIRLREVAIADAIPRVEPLPGLLVSAEEYHQWRKLRRLLRLAGLSPRCSGCK